MRSIRRTLKLSTLLLALALPIATLGQTVPQSPDQEQGLKPFATLEGSDIDSVSMINGNVSLNVPFFSYPQRGRKVKLDLNILYGNHSWFTQVCNNCNGGRGAIQTAWIGGQGVRVDDTQDMYATAYSSRSCGAAFCVAADGSSHLIGTTTAGKQSQSLDGSGIQLFYTSCGTNCSTATAVDRHGVSFSPLPSAQFNSAVQYWPLTQDYTKEDPNGNKITYDLSAGWTDTLGRVIPTVPHYVNTINPNTGFPWLHVAGGVATDSSGCKGPLAVTGAYLWSIPGPSGALLS